MSKKKKQDGQRTSDGSIFTRRYSAHHRKKKERGHGRKTHRPGAVIAAPVRIEVERSNFGGGDGGEARNGERHSLCFPLVRREREGDFFNL